MFAVDKARACDGLDVATGTALTASGTALSGTTNPALTVGTATTYTLSSKAITVSGANIAAGTGGGTAGAWQGSGLLFDGSGGTMTVNNSGTISGGLGGSYGVAAIGSQGMALTQSAGSITGTGTNAAIK